VERAYFARGWSVVHGALTGELADLLVAWADQI
jgi:hypothetical protein